jgi:hypothetical protein
MPQHSLWLKMLVQHVSCCFPPSTMAGWPGHVLDVRGDNKIFSDIISTILVLHFNSSLRLRTHPTYSSIHKVVSRRSRVNASGWLLPQPVAVASRYPFLHCPTIWAISTHLSVAVLQQYWLNHDNDQRYCNFFFFFPLLKTSGWHCHIKHRLKLPYQTQADIAISNTGRHCHIN